jgi:hypothetical protein
MNKPTTEDIVLAVKKDLIKNINKLRSTKTTNNNLVFAIRMMMQAHTNIVAYLDAQHPGYPYPIADYAPRT